jgi:tetratricopeptide (TPR) repeat protein
MITFRSILPLLVLSLTATATWCATAPTADEWAPVERALNENAPDAQEKLSALVKSFPSWSDGRRTLAQVMLRQNQFDAALVEAKQALALAPNDALSAAVAIQALGELGKPAEAFAIADRFVGDKDPEGWVNFRAAEIALAAGDRPKAELHLSFAQARAKKNPPAEFAYLDARISVKAGDLDRAELSLTRAVSNDPRLWNAWYELGVVQLRQAEVKNGATRRQYLEKSAETFAKVTANQPKDAHAWLGLGRAQLTLAQLLTVDSPGEDRVLAAKAAGNLKSAIEINPELRDAHLNLGVALLMTDDHDGAITHLVKARSLGSTSRTLGFNLMLAYQKAGRTADFESEARSVNAVSTAEKLTTGIGFYRAGNHALAAELLTSALSDPNNEPELIGAINRFIGHAYAAIAEQLRSKPDSDPAAIEAALDRARDAYRNGGKVPDYPAQHFFMAQETARSPDAGYAAGWQHLSWHGYTSIAGWKAVIGNYGGAATGGKGISGMWQRKPVHLVIWGLLGFVPLLIGVTALLRPKRVVVEHDDEPAPRPRSESVARPTTRPTTTRAAPTANQRPAMSPPRPSVKPPSGTIDSRRKPDTNSTLRPTKTAEKPIRRSGEFTAIERRTPRPGDGTKS